MEEKDKDRRHHHGTGLKTFEAVIFGLFSLISIIITFVVFFFAKDTHTNANVSLWVAMALCILLCVGMSACFGYVVGHPSSDPVERMTKELEEKNLAEREIKASVDERIKRANELHNGR